MPSPLQTRLGPEILRPADNSPAPPTATPTAPSAAPPTRTPPGQPFQALVRRERPRLLAFARRLTSDDSEDLVQETLLRGYRAYPSLRDDRAGGGWLRAILVNVHRDRARARARSCEEVPVADPQMWAPPRPGAEAGLSPSEVALSVSFLHSATTGDVRRVLLRLPEIYRTPLFLCHMAGFSTREVAARCHVPLGTMLARLHRGRAAFARQMWIYAGEQDLLAAGAGAAERAPAKSKSGRGRSP